MAMISHRLRRVLLTATSSFNRSFSISPTYLSQSPTISPSVSTVLQRSVLPRSSEVSRASSRLFSTRQYKLYKEGDEITEDTVLFEGCDYNHWLITMDFRKDANLTPEQMVATYEETCARGLGISLEEAKKKIYACSTTTYQGFQAIMTEEESEKFKDLPGVVFILPDSYIDPVNKEYGGDKYENGVITHRPPPVQNYRSRTRENRGPRFDRQGGGGGGGNFQRNPQFGQQPPMQGGGGNYGPPPSYGPPGQGTQAPPPSQGGFNQGPRSPPPPYQGGYNQSPGSPPPPYQGGYNQSPGSPPPPYQGGYNQGSVSTPSPSQGGYNQGAGSPPPPSPPSQVGYNQGLGSPPSHSQGGYNQVPESSPPPYQAGYNQNQRPPVPPNQGTPGGYGQGGPSNYNQGPQGGFNQGGPRNYGPPQGNGNLGPASGAGHPGFSQGYSGPGQQQNQTFPQADQRNREWNNNNPAGQPGSDQGRRY